MRETIKAERGSGGLGGAQLLTCAGLLVLPGWALFRGLSLETFGQAAGGVAGLSLLTAFITWLDKRRAEADAWRIPEALLHLLEMLGGWPGAYLAQRHFRHKTAKISYRVGFWLIVLLHQTVAVDFLLGWRGWHALMETV